MDTVKITSIRSVNLQSLGGARNLGVTIASGQYIAFLDADDLFSENWLYSAFVASKETPGSIIHPELNVFFGKQNIWWPHIDQSSRAFEPEALLYHNYWTALAFCPKPILTQIPYHSFQIETGFSFEDWHWNCETISQNFIHRTAAKTAHFIRLKDSGSLNQDSNINNSLIPHTKLYDTLGQDHRDPSLNLDFLVSKLLMKTREFMGRVFGLPNWAKKELIKLSSIEPLLCSLEISSGNPTFFNHAPRSKIKSDVFFDCLKRTDIGSHSYDYVYILPSPKSIDQILEPQKTGTKSLFMFTNSPEDLQLGKFQSINLGKSSLLSETDVKFILARLLIQIQPRHIQNFSSELGEQTLTLYGKQLGQYADISVPL